MSGGGSLTITTTQLCIPPRSLCQRKSTNRKQLYPLNTTNRKFSYLKDVGMRFEYSGQRIIEKADVDKIADDRGKFMRFPEFNDCPESQIMISIEHW